VLGLPRGVAGREGVDEEVAVKGAIGDRAAACLVVAASKCSSANMSASNGDLGHPAITESFLVVVHMPYVRFYAYASGTTQGAHYMGHGPQKILVFSGTRFTKQLSLHGAAHPVHRSISLPSQKRCPLPQHPKRGSKQLPGCFANTLVA
jgi:hypothetical protein